MHANIIEPCHLRLRKALAIRNMKQADLCQKTLIPRSAISHYVKGSFVPKQDRAFIIAKALDVNPAWLMGFDAPMEIEKQEKPIETMSKEKLDLIEQIKTLPEEKIQLLLQIAKSIR